jgi:hypothetical protein
MMRSMRRQLRAWKQDFLSVWGRLRSFHRVALSIVLAMGMVVVARDRLIDPLKAEIAAARTAMEEAETPDQVTLPEDDVEIQELQLKIESYQDSLASYEKERDEAIAAWPAFRKADRGKILAEMGDLITQSGLIRLEFHDDESAPPEADEKKTGRAARRPPPKPEEQAKPKAAEPLESGVYSYVLLGSFEAVRAFLDKISQFSYPARIENVSLQLDEQKSDDESLPPPVRPNAPPPLRLSFQLKLYFHE